MTDGPLALGWLAAWGAVIGAVIGSFLATLVLRWIAGRSIVAGRSACDGCARPLTSYDLIPIMGYLIARGRCRNCGGAIDPLHPLAETCAAVIGGAAMVVRPDWGGIALALLGWQLLTLAMFDARALWLPHRLTALLALSGLALGGIALGVPLIDRLIGAAGGFLSLFAVAGAYRALRGREGLGGGDPRLFGALGAWIGWAPLAPLLLCAALAGLAVAATRALSGDGDWRTMRLPFGTLLAMAMLPVLGGMLWM